MLARGSARAIWLVAALLVARASFDAGASPKQAPRRAPETGAARLLYGQRLDVNREPAEVLALLPGIGPARAHAILIARPLCSIDDLERVAGIGPVTLRALRGSLAFQNLPRNCDRELRPESH